VQQRQRTTARTCERDCELPARVPFPQVLPVRISLEYQHLPGSVVCDEHRKKWSEPYPTVERPERAKNRGLPADSRIVARPRLLDDIGRRSLTGHYENLVATRRVYYAHPLVEDRTALNYSRIEQIWNDLRRTQHNRCLRRTGPAGPFDWNCKYLGRDQPTRAASAPPTAPRPGSKKFRDVQRRPDVALVIDDLAAVEPWAPRGIEIRGRWETHIDGGEDVGRRLGADFSFDAAWIRIRPRRILAWGIDGGSFELSARAVPADVSVPERAA
jgi:hypothetical protein